MIKPHEVGVVSACADQPRERRPNIAFVSSLDPMDRRSFSGSFYFMVEALQKHCGDVHCLGPVRRSAVENAGRVLDQASRLAFRKGYDYSHSTLTAKRYARFFQEKLSRMHADLVYAPTAATEIAYLESSVPVVYGSDATPELLKEYYANYSNLFGFSLREAHSIERRAIGKASLVIYPTHWAAQSAVRDYQAEKSKVHVIPYGANFDHVPSAEVVLASRNCDECQLLFVGIDWVRKGGEIAVETLSSLQAMGIRARLTVCGCVPPANVLGSGVQVIPFLNKAVPIQRKHLAELYLASHILLLPTRSECFGSVFCEANAFGLPVITTNTGGIPSVISDGQNGFMLPMDARGPEYARVIANIWRDQRRYSELARASRKAFDERLNWDAWASALGKLLPYVVGTPRMARA